MLFSGHQVTVDISGDDVTPPSKVVDLQAVFTNTGSEDNSFIISFTSPGDDLDSEDPVQTYTIRYSQNLTALTFDSGTLLTDDDLDAGSTLTPVKGSVKVELIVK